MHSGYQVHLHLLFPGTKGWWVGVKEGGLSLSAHCPSQLLEVLGRPAPEEVTEEKEPVTNPQLLPNAHSNLERALVAVRAIYWDSGWKPQWELCPEGTHLEITAGVQGDTLHLAGG